MTVCHARQPQTGFNTAPDRSGKDWKMYLFLFFSNGLCILGILGIYSIKITAVVCYDSNISSLYFSLSIHLLGTVCESVCSQPMTIAH